MAKTALDAKRRDIFMLQPEQLTLVTDKNHPLYDPRVENPPDESMIANIAVYGVLEPILVRKNGSAIEVIAGRGRTKAAIEANKRLLAEGKPSLLIPAVVKGGSDADLFGILISENEIRRNDSMLIKGSKARKLLNMGYTIQQISVTFGVSRQSIENWLLAEELPEQIKEAIETGDISATAAIQVAEYSRDEQIERIKDIKEKGKKPTVQTMKSAANSQDNNPLPKMKTRKEIEKENSEWANTTEYTKGYKDALLWVLGEKA